MQVLGLIDHLKSLLDNASKIPMTNKTVIDKDEFEEILEQITEYLPEELKKAQWILQEKQRMMKDAKDEIESMKRESVQYYRNKISSHDFVKEAKIKAEKIVSSAELNSKTIKNGTKDYASEVITTVRSDIEEAKRDILKTIQNTVEQCMIELDKNLNDVIHKLKENQDEIRKM